LRGLATTAEAAALVARTARHFAHNVPVSTGEGAATIDTRFGRADLTAVGDEIAIVLAPAGVEAAGRLRDVVQSHLERFARAPLAVEWLPEDPPEGAATA
jgi:hypothetical protein